MHRRSEPRIAHQGCAIVAKLLDGHATAEGDVYDIAPVVDAIGDRHLVLVVEPGEPRSRPGDGTRSEVDRRGRTAGRTSPPTFRHRRRPNEALRRTFPQAKN